jgi:hypothetical protein
VLDKILVSDLGMNKSPVKPEQFLKAPVAREVKELGKIKSPVKPVQFSKAY